jgi:hypothetical protein
LAVFQSCTLVAAVSFMACLVLVDRLGHPIRTSTVWRYATGSHAEVKFKNRAYLKLLEPANVQPASAPFSNQALGVHFPLPPKGLKHEGSAGEARKVGRQGGVRCRGD